MQYFSLTLNSHFNRQGKYSSLTVNLSMAHIKKSGELRKLGSGKKPQGEQARSLLVAFRVTVQEKMEIEELVKCAGQSDLRTWLLSMRVQPTPSPQEIAKPVEVAGKVKARKLTRAEKDQLEMNVLVASLSNSVKNYGAH